MRDHGMYVKVLLILIIMFLTACGSYSSDPVEITAVGTIKEQGTTTYMYGTHILINDIGQTSYALTSDTINLDNYIDQEVTIKGDLVDGYPVDGGLDYLNIKSIQ